MLYKNEWIILVSERTVTKHQNEIIVGKQLSDGLAKLQMKHTFKPWVLFDDWMFSKLNAIKEFW